MLVQLSDLHIGADWNDVDPAVCLAATIEAVGALNRRPDAVLISGDLAETGADAEYEQVRQLLAALQAPIYVLAGNHDRRDRLLRHFAPTDVEDGFVQYTADVAGLRLVALDTTQPGLEGGELDADRLRWFEAALAAQPDRPTVVAMHHPPISVGIEPIDRTGLQGPGRSTLAEVVARHPQVRLVACGHVHRAVTGQLAGRVVVVAPSTFAELRLDSCADRVELDSRYVGFVVHTIADGEVISHTQSVEAPGRRRTRST